MNQISNRTEIQSLLKTLYRVAKTKKYTYRRLADELKISEATVKRWFYGSSCTLENLMNLCDVLEISFFDLSELAKTGEEVEFHLTLEQEAFFAKHPAYFGVLKQIHRKQSLKQIAEYWRVSSNKLFLVLRKLEKLNLLEVLAGERVRLKFHGNIHYLDNGLLAKSILRPQIGQFLDYVNVSLGKEAVGFHSAEIAISKAHLHEFVHELNSLSAKYSALAVRDQSLMSENTLKISRWLFALAEYQTNWRQYSL